MNINECRIGDDVLYNGLVCEIVSLNALGDISIRDEETGNFYITTVDMVSEIQNVPLNEALEGWVVTTTSGERGVLTGKWYITSTDTGKRIVYEVQCKECVVNEYASDLKMVQPPAVNK